MLKCSTTPSLSAGHAVSAGASARAACENAGSARRVTCGGRMCPARRALLTRSATAPRSWDRGGDEAGTYLPTEVCGQGIADKPGIPAAAARAAAAPHDASVNWWLGSDDDRRALVR
jgi:hypothetical protein